MNFKQMLATDYALQLKLDAEARAIIEAFEAEGGDEAAKQEEAE